MPTLATGSLVSGDAGLQQITTAFFANPAGAVGCDVLHAGMLARQACARGQLEHMQVALNSFGPDMALGGMHRNAQRTRAARLCAMEALVRGRYGCLEAATRFAPTAHSLVEYAVQELIMCALMETVPGAPRRHGTSWTATAQATAPTVGVPADEYAVFRMLAVFMHNRPDMALDVVVAEAVMQWMSHKKYQTQLHMHVVTSQCMPFIADELCQRMTQFTQHLPESFVNACVNACTVSTLRGVVQDACTKMNLDLFSTCLERIVNSGQDMSFLPSIVFTLCTSRQVQCDDMLFRIHRIVSSSKDVWGTVSGRRSLQYMTTAITVGASRNVIRVLGNLYAHSNYSQDDVVQLVRDAKAVGRDDLIEVMAGRNLCERDPQLKNAMAIVRGDAATGAGGGQAMVALTAQSFAGGAKRGGGAAQGALQPAAQKPRLEQWNGGTQAATLAQGGQAAGLHSLVAHAQGGQVAGPYASALSSAQGGQAAGPYAPTVPPAQGGAAGPYAPALSSAQGGQVAGPYAPALSSAQGGQAVGQGFLGAHVHRGWAEASLSDDSE